MDQQPEARASASPLDDDDDEGDNNKDDDEEQACSLVSIIEMNKQRQRRLDSSSSIQIGIWTGVIGEQKPASNGHESQMRRSSSCDQLDNVDFDTISCCNSLLVDEPAVRLGMRHSCNHIGTIHQNTNDAGRHWSAASSWEHYGVRPMVYGGSIKANIETYAETNEHNNGHPPSLASVGQMQPLVGRPIEDTGDLYCCACPGHCFDSGCNVAPGHHFNRLAMKKARYRLHDRHRGRRHSAPGDCIETAPHSRACPGARKSPPSSRQLSHWQGQRFCWNRPGQQPKRPPEVVLVSGPGGGCSRLDSGQFLVAPNGDRHERGIGTTETVGVGSGRRATLVQFAGEFVEFKEQQRQEASPIRGKQKQIAVAIGDHCGQSVARSSLVVVGGDQTSGCSVGGNSEIRSSPGAEQHPRGCSSFGGLVSRIKLFAASLVVSIRGRDIDDGVGDESSARCSLAQPNPFNSKSDSQGNLTTTTITTTTKQQPQEEQASCGRPTTNLSRKDEPLIDDARPTHSSPSKIVLGGCGGRSLAAKIIDVRRGGNREQEDNSSSNPYDTTGKRVRAPDKSNQLGGGEQLNDQALGYHQTSANDDAQTIVQSAASATNAEQPHHHIASGDGGMTDIASGNETAKTKEKEHQQRLQASAKMSSNASSMGNTNAGRQHLEQEPTLEVCNKTPSLQQIRQKHFSSTRFDERRSTHCSSSGAMTTTEPNCESSISSGGLNYCIEPIPHQYQQRQETDNNNNHHQQQQQTMKLTGGASGARVRGEEMLEANESCVSIRRAPTAMGCPMSGSSSLTSLEQTRVAPANKPGDPCRITFIPNNQKPPSKHGHDKPLKERDVWDKNIEFLLAVIGFAVDLGNIWRFPYICYKNGGGAFLIPYTIMFIFGGLPIFYLEMSLGQYFSSGCLTVWRRVCPMAKGIGYAMCVLNFFTGLYYNTIISWAVFFFVESFTLGSLPWTSCTNSWNSEGCKTIEQRQQMRRTYVNTSEQISSPTRDYFEREVLQIHLSKGIDDLGSIRTPLAIYLAIVFVCIYFAIWKGVKSTGKAVWITALLPYFVLIPLLVRGVLLEGSMLGIKYYLYPDWYRILDVSVWIDAAKQIYFALGPGFGTLMALSSYNRFNHNCRRDALIAAAVNYFASFIAGLVIFAVLGYMATIGRISIDKVATEGPGLVFQVYPEGLATMRFSAMWSVLFFMMVITLGIDSTFGGLESVITGLCDEYPRLLRAHRGIFIGLLIIVIYICSLPTTTYGGNYVIGLLESYGTSVSLLFIVTIETIVVCWLYGADKFCNNLKEMYGEMPGAYWRICWKYISPTILILIFIAACVQELDKYHTLKIDDYTYPGWAPTIGLLMTGSSVCCVPIYAIYYLKTKTSGSFYERLKSGSTPREQDETDEKDHNSTHLDTDI